MWQEANFAEPKGSQIFRGPVTKRKQHFQWWRSLKMVPGSAVICIRKQ